MIVSYDLPNGVVRVGVKCTSNTGMLIFFNSHGFNNIVSCAAT